MKRILLIIAVAMCLCTVRVMAQDDTQVDVYTTQDNGEGTQETYHSASGQVDNDGNADIQTQDDTGSTTGDIEVQTESGGDSDE